MLDYAIPLVAAVLALSFGFSYGDVGNQATYLPHALNFIDSQFLANDWLVRDTTAYHGSFRWVVAALAALGSVQWGAALLNIVLILIGLFVLHRILVDIDPGSAPVALVLLLLFVALDQTQTVAASYLFSGGLQPSVLATTGWLLTCWSFLRRQYRLSGILLGCAGIFHANFLVLGIGLFTLAHLFLQDERPFARWAVQIVPSFLALALSLPLILAAAGGSHAQQARDIFLTIRAPHHYVPRTYLTDFWYLGGWFACAASALLALPDIRLRRPLLALMGALAVSIAGATILTTVVFIPQISQLYVWRLAPFLLILCQAVVAVFLVNLLAGPAVSSRRGRAGLLLAALGGLAILRWNIHATPLSLQAAFILPLVLLYGVLWLNHRKRPGDFPRSERLFGVAAVAVILAVALPRTMDRIDKSMLIHPDTDRLYSWAHGTSRGAVFLVPPELGNFRLLAERAVVVDWKSTPIKPDELIAWYERINALAGQPVHSLDDAVAGYRARSLAQLNALALRYRANYIVVDKRTHKAAITDAQPVFSDGTYSVFRVALPYGRLLAQAHPFARRQAY